MKSNLSTTAEKLQDKNKVGRPSIYTKKLGDRICNAIRNNVRGLDPICLDNNDFPHPDTVRDWLCNGTYPEFSENYARAKQFQADLLAEEIIEVAYNAEPHYKNGGVDKAKLQVDALKWVAARLYPKKWSDKFKEKEDQKEETTKMTEDQLKDKFVDILNGVHERINKEKLVRKLKK
jgi:hypothetical protein